MQYSEGSVGRIFVVRLEDGDLIADALEQFAREKAIRCAMVIYVGGASDGSRLVVGPEGQTEDPIVPIIFTLKGIQEVLGVGTLFPDESGQPVLHMHGATGREGKATVGCTRAGVQVWLVGEVIVLEILGVRGCRRMNQDSGFKLLDLQ